MIARNRHLILTKVNELEEKKTKSGLVIPSMVEDKDTTAWGDVYECEDRPDQEYKKGDRVIFAKYIPVIFLLEDQEFWVITESDVIAVL